MTEWLRELQKKADAFTVDQEAEFEAERNRRESDRLKKDLELELFMRREKLEIGANRERAKDPSSMVVCDREVAPVDGSERCARSLGHDGPHKTRCGFIARDDSMLRCNLIEGHEGECETRSVSEKDRRMVKCERCGYTGEIHTFAEKFGRRWCPTCDNTDIVFPSTGTE